MRWSPLCLYLFVPVFCLPAARCLLPAACPLIRLAALLPSPSVVPVAVWLLTKRPTAAAAAAAAAPLPEVSLTAALSWERAGGSDRSGGGGGGGGGDDGVDPEEHKLLQLRRGGVPAASSGSKLRTGAAEGMQPCLSFAKK